MERKLEIPLFEKEGEATETQGAFVARGAGDGLLPGSDRGVPCFLIFPHEWEPGG
jgi:hypothetical protein